MSTIIEDISVSKVLDSIGENIILADLHYNIVWMNEEAERLFNSIAPLFGFKDSSGLVGENMDRFHVRPVYQRGIMTTLQRKHKARINIKDQFIADIVISPLQGSGEEVVYYVVMLMDVTTKAEEEERKDLLIESLSVPILKIWDKTIAVPFIGEMNKQRSDQMISFLLKECAEHDIQYAMIDLSGVQYFNELLSNHIDQLHQCLKLIGTECLLVGVTPKLALSFANYTNKMVTFKNAHAGLEFILKARPEKLKNL